MRLLIFLLFLLLSCKELPKETPFSHSPSTPEVEETPAPPVNPECGPKQGFLWKPRSENKQLLPNGERKRTAVALLPPVFKAGFSSVCIIESRIEECGRSTGFSNGDRQTIRFNHPGCDYGENFLLVAVDENQACEFRIVDGCLRQENG